MGDPQPIEDPLRAVLHKLESALATEAEQALWEARSLALTREQLLRASGVDEVLDEAGVAAVVQDAAESTRALELMRAWVASSVPIFALFGGKGVGKTVAAAWALSRLPGRYIEADDLGRLKRAHFGGPGAEYRACMRTELLVVDELGLEDDEELARAMLQDVVNRRQRLPRRTLLLGNLDRRMLDERYDARTIDRLREVAVIRSVRGESLRGRE